MQIIEQNPYRQLGVFANSPTRERVANHNRLKAFLKVGRQVSFPLDLSQHLSAIERTAESVADADAKLTLPKDQLKYGQFWFVKSTPIDDIAFNHLFAGNLDDAIGLWDKRDDASSLQNRTVCYLIKGEYESALICAQKLYADFIDQFVSLVLGDGSNVTTDELSHDFLDTICEEVGSENMLRYLEAVHSTEWKEYVGKATIAPIIQKIQDAISTAKGRKGKGPAECLAAGKKLMSTTKPLLEQLQKLLPKTDLQYQMIADKLGLEILQCGIDYYNASDELDCATKAMQLQEYALKIVVGKMAKDRCQENFDILKKIIAELPPAEVFGETKAIKEALGTAAAGNASIPKIETLLNESKPHLQSMKTKLGDGNAYYLKMSTLVARIALAMLVSVVNKAQESAKLEIMLSRDLSGLKSTLTEAWRLTMLMDKMDFEVDFRKQYKQNRKILKDICKSVGVSTQKRNCKGGIKWWFGIGLFVAILIVIYLIWGIKGLSVTCASLAAILGFVAFAGLRAVDSGQGCAVVLVCGAMAALFGYVAHPLDEFADVIDKRKEAKELYEQINDNPTEGACSDYIRKFSGYEHTDEVRDVWLALLINESQGFDYESAEGNYTSSSNLRGKNPIQKLQNFIDKNNSKYYQDKAKSFIETICDSLYDVATHKSTVVGWRQYQRVVPTEYYRDSAEKIEEIENKAWDTESKAWKQATTENSIDAYRKYKTLYPGGAHISTCEKKLIDLEVSNIYAGEHGTLPAMDKTGYGGGSTSYVTVKNSTSYILTLMYSGPDSKKLVIEAGKTGSITLKNGKYRVAASVSARNVGNYAGIEELQGGSYSADYYISSHYYHH